MEFETLKTDIAACTLCADRFAATKTAHRPNPVIWFQPGARLLIASQAPGLRVHQANTPFWDASGKRLRDWLGMDEATFYDRKRVAILPMAFCFPGYDAAGSDLPPPRFAQKPGARQPWHSCRVFASRFSSADMRKAGICAAEKA